jgi:hypothetical protein
MGLTLSRRPGHWRRLNLKNRLSVKTVAKIRNHAILEVRRLMPRRDTGGTRRGPEKIFNLESL